MDGLSILIPMDADKETQKRVIFEQINLNLNEKVCKIIGDYSKSDKDEYATQELARCLIGLHLVRADIIKSVLAKLDELHKED